MKIEEAKEESVKKIVLYFEKMKIEEAKEESVPVVDYFGNLPNELINNVLTYLSYEEIDNLRLVNKKFKAACDCRLNKGYLKVKQELDLCCERIYHSINSLIFSCSPIGFYDFAKKMFWFFVCEFFKNSFCLFDILEGYLDVKYSVNGKTIDLVQRILWLKDVENPICHLVELMIGRSATHSNMKCYYDFGPAYSQWFIAKKYCGVDITSIYVPLLDKREPGLMFPIMFDFKLAKQSSAMMLDILSTLWIEKSYMDTHLLWHSESRYGGMWTAKMIPVLKPGQDEDPTLYFDEDSNSDSDSDSDESVDNN